MNPKFSDIFYFLSPKANTKAKIFHFFFFKKNIRVQLQAAM